VWLRGEAGAELLAVDACLEVECGDEDEIRFFLFSFSFLSWFCLHLHINVTFSFSYFPAIETGLIFFE